MSPGGGLARRGGVRSVTEKGTDGHEGVREEGQPRPGGLLRRHEGALEVPAHERLQPSPSADRVRGASAGSASLHEVARGGDDPPSQEARGRAQGADGPGEQAARGQPAARAGLQPEREARQRPLRVARADHLAARGGRQALRAAVDLRRLPLRQRGRHREHPGPGAQGQGQPAPVDQGRGHQAGPGTRAQRGAERRRDRGLRDPGRRGRPQGNARRRARGRDPASRRGEGGHRGRPPAAGQAQGRRSHPDGPEERLSPGEAPQERGRGPQPRGGPGHRVRGHRGAPRPARGHPRRRRAARISTRTTTRSTTSPRPRACSCTGRRAAARP